MKTIRLTSCASMLAILALAGCASTTPQLDSKFSHSVNAAKSQQTINPDAGKSGNADGIDGGAAKESVDRYRDSYKSPPPATNIINIGIGSGGR